MHRACQVIRPAGNTKCVCEFGWKGRNCTEEYDPCKEHSCVNNGKCVPDENDEKDYRCECPYDFLGDYCQNQRPCHPKCEPCTKMAHMCKNNSTCWPGDTLRDGNFQCICKKGYEGQFCDLEIPCEAYNPCKNGGDCYREDGEVVCECLSIWTGPTCEIFNICHDDKCVNGICNAVGETNYTCACWKGYTGDHCEIKINECERDPYPCMNNGSCIDKIADYECSCPVGTSGKSCEHNFDDCADPTRGITNRCSKRDKKAICHDGINEFKCECSPDWTGETCSMRLMIYEILKHFNSYDEGLVQMLEDLIEKPELIKETLPFFLALMPPENQTKISWDHEDIFEWASFEGAELNLKKDIVKWNGATLGNCFTFNHDSRPQKFPLHYGGEKERFQAMMRVRQDEYLDWIDTSSLLVFVHSSKESVFGESVRFQAMPGGKTNIMTSLTAFERLGGKYGKCASDRSEVNSYYYSGEYTTDGCLRSCYQDAVFEACNCMDPRFPIAEGVRACDLGRRSCVVNVTQHRGDPSNWPDCECPPPCSNGQHNVRWSYAPFIKEDCSAYTGNNATLQKCLAKADSALISVYMPHIIQNTFKEEAKMDFNKFISMLGGLLGVLCGVCIITLAEFLLLIVEVVVYNLLALMASARRERDHQGLIERLTADWNGDFNNVKHLADGGFGSVFYAWQKSRKRPVAIKMVNLLEDRSKRVLDEIETLHLLRKHLHVVTMYDNKKVGDYVYILMEFCEGGSLRSYLIKHGALSEKAASHVIRQVYSAVRMLHSQKIIHRDLTTNNVLIKEAKDPNSIAVRLCDFGLVSDTKKKAPQTVAGTPGFMDPAILNNQKYDLRVDMYSMGCLLYSMLLQKDPPRFTREGVINDMVQEVNNSRISSGVKDLIKGLLNKEFKDIEDLKHYEFMSGNDIPMSRLASYSSQAENKCCTSSPLHATLRPTSNETVRKRTAESLERLRELQRNRQESRIRSDQRPNRGDRSAARQLEDRRGNLTERNNGNEDAERREARRRPDLDGAERREARRRSELDAAERRVARLRSDSKSSGSGSAARQLEDRRGNLTERNNGNEDAERREARRRPDLDGAERREARRRSELDAAERRKARRRPDLDGAERREARLRSDSKSSGSGSAARQLEDRRGNLTERNNGNEDAERREARQRSDLDGAERKETRLRSDSKSSGSGSATVLLEDRLRAYRERKNADRQKENLPTTAPRSKSRRRESPGSSADLAQWPCPVFVKVDKEVKVSEEYKIHFKLPFDIVVENVITRKAVEIKRHVRILSNLDGLKFSNRQKVEIHSNGATRSYSNYSSLTDGDRTLYQDAIARINEYINTSLRKFYIAKIENLRHFTEKSSFYVMANGSCRLHLSNGEKIIRSSTGEYKGNVDDRIRRVMDFYENLAMMNWKISEEKEQVIIDDSQAMHWLLLLPVALFGCLAGVSGQEELISKCRQDVYIRNCPNGASNVTSFASQGNQLAPNFISSQLADDEDDFNQLAVTTLTILSEIGSFTGDVLLKNIEKMTRLFEMVSVVGMEFLDMDNFELFDKIKEQFDLLRQHIDDIRDELVCEIYRQAYLDIGRIANDFARTFNTALVANSTEEKCMADRCLATQCVDLRPGEQLNRLEFLLRQPNAFASQCLKSSNYKLPTYERIRNDTQFTVFMLGVAAQRCNSLGYADRSEEHVRSSIEDLGKFFIKYKQLQYTKAVSDGLRKYATDLANSKSWELEDLVRTIDEEAEQNYADEDYKFVISAEFDGNDEAAQVLQPESEHDEAIDRAFLRDVNGLNINIVRILRNTYTSTRAERLINCCLDEMKEKAKPVYF
ncbi:hypothetical protein QR680_010098 [Steinernema hermaphroditum]|uniref:Uncharacterized protein n=1 Tax=Steinernema hermaphroditum TaxID=289476 RepID=A0AA39IPM3_9BILA|nr:hypothetical protein QR680_010098 [Steinernema hermaphroditum]